MIARGTHIETVNESFAIRKSADGVTLMDDSSPYNACAGSLRPHEVTDVLLKASRPTIDDLIASRQNGE